MTYILFLPAQSSRKSSVAMVRQNHNRKLLPEHARGRGGHLRGGISHYPLGYELPISFELEIRVFMVQNSTPACRKTLFVDTAPLGGMDLLQIYDDEDLRSLPSGVCGIKN